MFEGASQKTCIDGVVLATIFGVWAVCICYLAGTRINTGKQLWHFCRSFFISHYCGSEVKNSKKCDEKTAIKIERMAKNVTNKEIIITCYSCGYIIFTNSMPVNFQDGCTVLTDGSPITVAQDMRLKRATV